MHTTWPCVYLLSTLYSWKPHMAYKMSYMFFSDMQGRPAWIGFWRQLLPPTFGCNYKILVTCASDNEERRFLNKMWQCLRICKYVYAFKICSDAHLKDKDFQYIYMRIS